jgi:tetratricopeptide (TPR) repeat protein
VGRYYYWTLPLLILVFGICYQYFDITEDNERLILAIIALYFITAAPAMRLLYLKETKVNFVEGGMNFAILETLTITDKEYIDTDFDSDRIEEKQQKFISSRAQKNGVTGVYVFPATLRMPRLFYLINNVKKVKEKLRTYLGPEKYVAILVTTKDKGGGRIEFDVVYENFFMHDGHLSNFWNNFNAVILEEPQSEDYIFEVSKIFSAQITQSILDMATGMGNFVACHVIIDDCLEVFEKSFNKISAILGDEKDQSLQAFKSDMIANMEVYRASTYMNQKEYLAAVRHHFRAIKANPYFPFQKYGEFRDAYNRKYIASILVKAEAVEEAFDDADENQNPERERFNPEGRSIYQEFPFAQFHEERLLEVIREVKSTEINSAILTELQKDFAPTPISLIIKGELLKYLPKGTLKHEQMYIDRIPEVIALFEKALEMDPDFVLLHGRIGTLILIQALYTVETKRESLYKKAAKKLELGREIYTRFGFEIGSKSKSSNDNPSEN